MSEVTPYKAKETMPTEVKKFYGCHNCEWKNTSLCPYSFKHGPGHDPKQNHHKGGMCTERQVWLVSMSPDMGKKTSFNQWQLHLNRQITQSQQLKDYVRLQEAEFELSKAIQSKVKKEIEFWTNRVSRFRDEWMGVMKEALKYGDKQVERETVKKIDVGYNNLKLSDIHEIMASNLKEDEVVVDADFEEVEDDS